jgi:hypothetical protein
VSRIREDKRGKTYRAHGTGEVGSHRVGIIEGEPEERGGARNVPAYSGRRREDEDA